MTFSTETPCRLYLGTEDGLRTARADSEGLELLESGLDGNAVRAIDVAPDDPDRVFVATGAGLHRSDDGGDSWQTAGGGLPAASPADTLRIHPRVPETLFYAGDTGDGESRLFVSSDGGDSWDTLGGLLPRVWRLEVAVGGA